MNTNIEPENAEASYFQILEVEGDPTEILKLKTYVETQTKLKLLYTKTSTRYMFICRNNPAFCRFNPPEVTP